jgi:ubiquinone/menaquinone biosynthesis C-methylase UbiE
MRKQAVALAWHDLTRGITRKAQREVKKRGLESQLGSQHSDFGKRLEYYVPIHEILLHHSGGSIKGKKILHFGASSGIYARFLQDKGAKAIAMDISNTATKIARKIGNKRVLRADARTIRNNSKQSLPFKDESIDFFVSDRFLFSNYPEIEDARSNTQSNSILKELHRVLKPRGIGIIYAYSTDHVGNKEINSAGFEMQETIVQKMDGTYTPLLVLRKK